MKSTILIMTCNYVCKARQQKITIERKNFSMLIRLNPLHPTANKISRFQKSKMTVAILKIRKIAISPQQNDRF